MTDNPLLDFSGLPRFDAIRPEHVTPAIEQLLEKNRAAVAQLEAPSGEVTWDNFVTPLENSTELLNIANELADQGRLAEAESLYASAVVARTDVGAMTK